MTPAILSIRLENERDIVLARQRARQIAALLGFDGQDQTRIATAVSEIARNAFAYATGGRVEFRIEGTTVPQVLLIIVEDKGKGIRDLDAILDGRYRSPKGMGLGIVGVRRLMDHFDIRTGPGGTRVALKKLMPRELGTVSDAALAGITKALTRQEPRDPIEEVQQQNQELLHALDELKRRQDELIALNAELEDTNRGVVALYAELDEKADHLRRADDIKTRFLSNMSHEFRTPVNSIQALARLLLQRLDGSLTPEQERQIGFIEKAADSLSELVNDLLDLAKVEAGKTVVRPVDFELGNLFGALRGMLRPLLLNESVQLVFEEPEDVPPLHTDEGKVSQILRNFISNSLKFTERGEVRVRATLRADGRRVAIAVEDTGIGIAPEDQERIFQEFAQIESPIQRRVRGTGLGLPLCRRLAELLGGRVMLASEPGIGSIFTLEIPMVYTGDRAAPRIEVAADPSRVPVLVVEDDVDTVMLYERFLHDTPFQMFAARDPREARDTIARVKPRAIVLDILLRGQDAWDFLAELKRHEATRETPVAVVSTLEDPQKAAALGADDCVVKPVDRHRLLQMLTRLTAPHTMKRILIVDDEEVPRYILRHYLAAPHHVIEEAASGDEALRRVREEAPDLVCLDLSMPGMSGHDVLRELRSDPSTRGLPVLIVSSSRLGESERRALLGPATSFLSKEDLSGERVVAAFEAALGASGRAA